MSNNTTSHEYMIKVVKQDSSINSIIKLSIIHNFTTTLCVTTMWRSLQAILITARDSDCNHFTPAGKTRNARRIRIN